MSLTPSQLADQQTLQAIAQALSQDCPDMRQMARTTAQQILRTFNQAARDPDTVYLHRFDRAHNSPDTFSGWAHTQSPYQSYTLPQLVMHRFDVHDQDNADLLGYRTGFYSDGPNKPPYDQHNEVAIAPKDVLEYFWQIDFCATFRRRASAFWLNHADDFRTLAKANFLGKVLEACANQPNSPLALRAAQVAQALTGDPGWPPTVAQLQRQVLPAAGFRLCTFDIGGHLATDVLRVELPDGQQLLYLPGEVDALHLFANHDALYWWVLEHNNHADNRARFMAHFALASRGENSSSVGLNHMLDLLYFNWGGSAPTSLNQLDRSVSTDAFSYLRDQCRQRMLDDEQFALRSNADLRKQLWIGYLRAFGQVAGAMAAVDWPIALAAVGAGLAETGLDIDQAINGHTTAERQAGTLGAILAAVNTLFNATLLTSAPGEALDEIGQGPAVNEHAERESAGEPSAVEADRLATPAEVHTWVPEPLRPSPASQRLQGFETNEILAGDPGSGIQAGIYTQRGHFYALIEQRPYQVRYVGEARSWVVVDPQNPFSFYRNLPIQLSPDGEWQLVEPLGLKGGVRLPRLAIFGRPAPQPELPELLPTPYEIPAEQRPYLQDAASRPDTHTARFLKGDYAASEPPVEAAAVDFRAARDRLAADAREFFRSFQPPARPTLPEVSASTSAKGFIRGVYQESQGLVIGEAHSGLGSKRLLIDNMRELRKQNVRVLYMEHLMTDFQQADLDAFNRSGVMPDDLKEYLSNLDVGYGNDRSERYTFSQVLRSAQKEGIRVQSIDCMASYRQAWDVAPSPVIRQEMMNFHAHLVINADQAARGASKWVALMGNSHSNLFEGVPGVSELQGAIGLRVEDIAAGQPERFSVDPGSVVVVDASSIRHIRGDLRLQAPLAKPRPDARSLEERLRVAGDFSFVPEQNQLYLVHRAGDSTLVRTLVHEEAGYIFIERPKWSWAHKRHLASLAVLRTVLTRNGLRYVAQ